MPEVATAPAAPSPVAAPVTTTINAKPVAKAPVSPTPPKAQEAKAEASVETEKPEESLEITVDGAPKRVTRKEAEKLLGKSAYADKVISQAKEALRATQAKEAERTKRLETIKTDKAARDAFLREHGIEPETFAREVLEAKVRERQMTQEQRDAAAQAEENQRLKSELETRTKAEQEAQQGEVTKHLQHQLETQLKAAATKAGIEPGSESFFAIYQAVQEAFELNLPWDPERIIEVAKENLDGAQSKLEKAMLKGLTGGALLKRLGPEVVKAVVAARWAEIQEAKGGGAQKAQLQTQRPPAKASPYINLAQAREQMKKLGGGR